MNMVEIMARAMADKAGWIWDNLIPDTQIDPASWNADKHQSYWREQARAALLAMRDNVTPGMRQACLRELSGPTDFAPKASAWDAQRAYRAMIDEALKEGEA